MRSFKLYCVEVGNDGSEFQLVFEINGNIKDIKTEYCFENILISSSEFLSKNCEKYGYDGRFDSFEVNLNYKFS
jgi:hypothetical protein